MKPVASTLPSIASVTAPVESDEEAAHANALPLPPKAVVAHDEKVRFSPPFSETAHDTPSGASTLVLPDASMGGLAEAPKVVMAFGSPLTPISTILPCMLKRAGSVEALLAIGV
jgi:hypothetical protein